MESKDCSGCGYFSPDLGKIKQLFVCKHEKIASKTFQPI